MLAPREDAWSGMEPAQQERLARGAARWLEMNDGQRTRARDRFDRWRSLSEAERASIRERYGHIPSPRAAAAGPHSPGLPEFSPAAAAAERSELRRRFRALPPDQRGRTLRDRRLERRDDLRREDTLDRAPRDTRQRDDVR